MSTFSRLLTNNVNNPRWQIFCHLAILYFSWGSTYLAFKWCLSACGPFSLAGLRMTLAGALLSLFLCLSGKWQKPSRKDLLHSIWLSFFMVFMGCAFLAKGQAEGVASSVASIITSSTPISMLLAAWLFAGESRPSKLQCLGLLGSVCGLFLLSQGQATNKLTNTSDTMPFLGCFYIFCATWGWVAGSLLARHFPQKTQLSALQNCALLLFIGGLECILVGLCLGEYQSINLQNLSLPALLSFFWMSIGGGILAYSSYFWLLEHTSIAIAVSYEYVVPVVGVFLGWSLANEEINLQTLFACFLIVISVFFVIWTKKIKH